MVFKNRCVLVLWIKEASALEQLNQGPSIQAGHGFPIRHPLSAPLSVRKLFAVADWRRLFENGGGGILGVVLRRLLWQVITLLD